MTEANTILSSLNDLLAKHFGHLARQMIIANGDCTMVLAKENLIASMQILRDHDDFKMIFLSDLTVVDYLTYGSTPPQQERFSVVYHLFSPEKMYRLRIRVPISEQDCQCPSLTDLWLSANWMEREAWEFYGVVFTGHPDLRHILLYPEFQGYPLRKDYPKAGEQPRIELRDYRPWPKPKPAQLN